MSIAAQIGALEGAGKLQRYNPRSRYPPKRRLYLGGGSIKDFNDPSSAVNLLVGKGYIEAALTRWVSGGLVYGDNKKGRFLDRLASPPSEIWEIRVTEPVVQARLFGRFAEPDTLILTNFHTRKLLGTKNSAAWTAAMATCAAAWHELFPSHGPFVGADVHSYIKENCDAFPLKP